MCTALLARDDPTAGIRSIAYNLTMRDTLASRMLKAQSDAPRPAYGVAIEVTGLHSRHDYASRALKTKRQIPREGGGARAQSSKVAVRVNAFSWERNRGLGVCVINRITYGSRQLPRPCTHAQNRLSPSLNVVEVGDPLASLSPILSR